MINNDLKRLEELYHQSFRVKLTLDNDEQIKYNEIISLYNDVVKDKYKIHNKELIVTFTFYDNEIKGLRCNLSTSIYRPVHQFIYILGVTFNSIGYSFESVKTDNFIDSDNLIFNIVDNFDSKIFLLKKLINNFNSIIEKKFNEIKSKKGELYDKIYSIGVENEILLDKVKTKISEVVLNKLNSENELFNFYFKNRNITIINGGIDYNNNFYISFFSTDYNRKLFGIEIDFTKNKVKIDVSKNTFILNEKLTVEKFLNKTLRKEILKLIK